MTGFEGDPYHEGSVKPLAHLKGTDSEVHVQMPLESTGDTNSNQEPSPYRGWADSTIQNTLGLSTGSSDSRKPH